MLIDTGCTNTMVSANYIDSGNLDYGNTEKILCIHGDMVCYPTAEVYLRLGQWSRAAKVVVAPGLPVPVLLGTDIYRLTASKPVMVTVRVQAKRGGSAPKDEKKATEPQPDTDKQQKNEDDLLVEEIFTIQQDEDLGEGSAEQEASPMNQYHKSTIEEEEYTEQRREELPDSTPQECKVLEATAEDIRRWQAQDPTLQKVREEAGDAGSDLQVGFYYEDGLLHRKWRLPMAGHMGITRTKDRLLQRYYWPGIFTEVANYCQSCEVCQKSDPKCPLKAGFSPLILTYYMADM